MPSIKNPPSLTASAKAELVREFADDMKAERIEVIDVSKKTSVTNILVLCSGTSDVHVNSIGDKVAEKLREKGVRPLRTNAGAAAGGWLLYDFGDVVFHVMLEEKRQFYDLETLWTTAPDDPTLLQ